MRANAWTLLPLSLGAAACCKNGGGVQSQQGTLAIQDGQTVVTNGADDFGTACPGGQGITHDLSLVATSNADVDVSVVSVTGSGGFTASVPSLPLTIPAGTSVSLPVTFVPPSAGAQTSKLVLTSDAANSPTTVTLSGTGSSSGPTPGYAATCDGGLCGYFGSVGAGTTADQAIVISDTGCDPLSIESVVISGAADGGAGPFGLPGLPALPISVALGTPFALTVSYTPVTSDEPDTATLTVSTNAPDGGVFEYALTGYGVAPDVQLSCSGAGCSGDPTPSYDFGAVAQGATVDAVFTVENQGSAPVTLEAPALDTNGPYSIASSWQAGTVLGGLQSGSDTVTCTVQFTSPGNGVFDDQLLVAYTSASGSGMAYADLVAHSSGLLCPNPNPLVLPATGYCGSSSATLTLDNCGNADITVNGLGFADGGNPRGTFSAAVSGGLTLPQTIAADAGLGIVVTYRDDGDLTDPFATLLVQSNGVGAPDGGTPVSVIAQVEPVPRPGDSPAEVGDAGVGCNVAIPFAAAPGNDAPLYSYTWSIVGSCSGTVTLVSDGGDAWATPTADESGSCDICLQAWEQPVDGGFTCGFDAGSVGHCTPLPPVTNCP